MQTSENKQTLALFDFDGTLTNKDSAVAFLKFIDPKNFNRKVMSAGHVFIGYYLKLLSDSKAKVVVLRKFLKGKTTTEIAERAKVFGADIAPKIIRPDALAALEKHKANGDRVIVVSASCELWLKSWCDAQNIELIGTLMEVENGVITGNLQGKNCRGPEKVNRIKAHLNLDDYGEIHAYGDTSGDKEMLDIATHPNYRVFTQ